MGRNDDEGELPWCPPLDPRFPNQNQSYACFTMFLDYHRCIRLLGKDYEGCEYFKRVYSCLCPNVWVEKWNNQLEDGTFPGPLPVMKEDKK